MNLALKYYFILHLLAGDSFKTGRDYLVEIGGGSSVGKSCEGRLIACDFSFSVNSGEVLVYRKIFFVRKVSLS